MRKVTSALVLAVLLVHLAGAYVFVMVRMGEIRKEQRMRLASLPADQLELLQIPVGQFRSAWLAEREMKWGGRMYDLARVTRMGSVMMVYALHDRDEDNLLAFLSAVIDTAREDGQPAPASIVEFFTLDFITSSILLPDAEILLRIDIKPGAHLAIPAVVLDPVFPPPRS